MRLTFKIGGALLALLVVGEGLVPAQAMTLLVPSYFNPGSDWDKMAASAPQVGITAILNPNSGPGPSPDPGYIAAIDNLRAAGGCVIAYVSTANGSRPLADVEQDINLYIAQGYNLNGFFIDEMSNLSSGVSYYTTLYQYIKSLSPAYTVVGNPGADTLEAYMQCADVLLTYENSSANYPADTFPSWVANYPADRFANVIYNAFTTADLQNTLDLASTRNVGAVYVTDLVYNDPNDNPYASLPSYWDEEVELVAGVPEPGTWAMLLSALSLLVGGSWLRRGRVWTVSPPESTG